MGCSASSVLVNPPDPFNEAITKKVRERVALIEKKSSKGKHISKSLQAMCMAFPRLRKGFAKLRELYDGMEDEKKGGIKFDILANSDMFKDNDTKMLQSFLTESDMDSNKVIDFREFILIACFVYFMDEEKKWNMDKLLEDAFDFVAQSWTSFDKDEDGTINKKESIDIINGNVESQPKESFFTAERFNEMDGSHTGDVRFKDFFLAFVEWSGVDFKD